MPNKKAREEEHIYKVQDDLVSEIVDRTKQTFERAERDSNIMRAFSMVLLIVVFIVTVGSLSLTYVAINQIRNLAVRNNTILTQLRTLTEDSDQRTRDLAGIIRQHQEDERVFYKLVGASPPPPLPTLTPKRSVASPRPTATRRVTPKPLAKATAKPTPTAPTPSPSPAPTATPTATPCVSIGGMCV